MITHKWYARVPRTDIQYAVPYGVHEPDAALQRAVDVLVPVGRAAVEERIH